MRALVVSAMRLMLPTPALAAFELRDAAPLWLGRVGRGSVGGRFTTWAGVDRALRGSALREALVPASIEWGASVRASGASLCIADRWEPDGRDSPRLWLEIPLGDAAGLVLGRG